VASNPLRHGHAACADASGEAVPCCVWLPSAWVAPFLPLALATLSWAVLLLFEAKVRARRLGAQLRPRGRRCSCCCCC
jgi:hypothetical protein